MAFLGGFNALPGDSRWLENISLLEPPAGQHVPYIDPEEALVILLRHQGATLEEARVQASEVVSRMRADVAENHWVVFFDRLEPESPECLPVPEFVAWLRRERCRVPPDILDFLEQAAEVTASTAIFRGPDNWDEPWVLADLPALPPPRAMIVYVPGMPWEDLNDWSPDRREDWRAPDNPFMLWREAMRGVAQALEQVRGEPVYYFADLDCDTDDDGAHRFLVLHWCCTWKPESTFVRYLMKVSGARDVEELKSGLLDPASYTHPFKMNDALFGLESSICRLEYLPPDQRKTVTVLFATEKARQVAQWLLAQQIGTYAVIIAPNDLLTDEWVKSATRYCRDWEVRYLHNDTLNEPLDILAATDVLYVIANEKTPGRGFDLKLSDGSEDLLWLAFELGIKANFFNVDRSQLANPELCLQKRGVPERVAARKAQRTAFTWQLQEIRLDNDFSSSGLWDKDGKMLGYDLLDLPFPLVRRIAAWQRDYDETLCPPSTGSDQWLERHFIEESAIARELEAALGSTVTVKLYRQHCWQTVDQISQMAGGEP